MSKYTDKERMEALERLYRNGYVLLIDDAPDLAYVYYFLQDEEDSSCKPVYAGRDSIRAVVDYYLDAYYA